MGIGGELLGSLPLLVANMRFGSLGTKLGIGVRDSNPILSIDGKFYLLFKWVPVDLYVGPGLLIGQAEEEAPPSPPLPPGSLPSVNEVAVSQLEETTTYQIGFDLTAGVEFLLYRYGIPFSLYGGLGYLSLPGEGSTTGEVGPHLGVRLEF